MDCVKNWHLSSSIISYAKCACDVTLSKTQNIYIFNLISKMRGVGGTCMRKIFIMVFWMNIYVANVWFKSREYQLYLILNWYFIQRSFDLMFGFFVDSPFLYQEMKQENLNFIERHLFCINFSYFLYYFQLFILKDKLNSMHKITKPAIRRMRGKVWAFNDEWVNECMQCDFRRKQKML